MDETLKKNLIIYFFFSGLGALLYVISMKPEFGFMLRLITWVVAVGPGVLGAMLGNAIRRWIMPDFVIGGGFFDLLKQRVFWGIGPQAVGMAIGLALGAGLVIKIAGY